MEAMMSRRGVKKIILAAERKGYSIENAKGSLTIIRAGFADQPGVSVTLYRSGIYVRDAISGQPMPIRTLRLIRKILDL